MFYTKILTILKIKLGESNLDKFKEGKKLKVISENIICDVFIHNEKGILRGLNLKKDEIKEIDKFRNLLGKFTKVLQDRNVKSIATIIILIPKGLFKSKYIDKFVIRKTYGSSVRFHYQDGIFEIIKEKDGK